LDGDECFFCTPAAYALPIRTNAFTPCARCFPALAKHDPLEEFNQVCVKHPELGVVMLRPVEHAGSRWWEIQMSEAGGWDI
jgi:hypothetical protein